jgi:hypothetical protein
MNVCPICLRGFGGDHWPACPDYQKPKLTGPVYRCEAWITSMHIDPYWCGMGRVVQVTLKPSFDEYITLHVTEEQGRRIHEAWDKTGRAPNMRITVELIGDD